MHPRPRTLAEILVAHRMDPSLRELFVEGDEDRQFIMALMAGDYDGEALIWPISSVDAPEPVGGGERGRLLWLAAQVGTSPAAIRVFADRDDDGILGVAPPANGWFTDWRDLESYVFNDPCFAKFAILIPELQIANTRAKLLESILGNARRLGFLRLVSRLDALQLPFAKTDLRRSLSWDGSALVLDMTKFVDSLLSNAGISRKKTVSVLARLVELEGVHAGIDTRFVAQGKDCLDMLDHAIRKRKQPSRSLLLTFDRSKLSDLPSLSAALQFVERGA